MALDFYLKLQTTLKPEEINNKILELEGFEKDEDDNRFSAKGIVGGIFLMDEISQEILFEEVHIKANTRVWFWLDAGEEELYEKGLRNGLKAFMAVLQNTNGDAVIRLNDDDVKLIRKDDRVILNSESFFEDEEAIWRIKDVPLYNFEVRKLAWNGEIIT